MAEGNGGGTELAEGDGMTDAAAKLTLLERRTLEARIVGPLVRAFMAEFGAEATLAIVRQVITELASESGAELARTLGDDSLRAFAGCVDAWKAGGALELRVLAQDDEHLAFDVTRCRFAEMYRALGLAELGASLSCRRDFALVGGFNPEIKLERSQTIMEGAEYCDFRFRKRHAAEKGE